MKSPLNESVSFGYQLASQRTFFTFVNFKRYNFRKQISARWIRLFAKYA
jgi:hypothetical protein